MKSKVFFTLFLLVCALLFSSPSALADTHYVKWNSGNPQSPYNTTWDEASHTIGQAMNVADDGDTVLVWAGTYNETPFMFEGIELKSYGTDGTDATEDYPSALDPKATVLSRAVDTIIDGGGLGPVVTFEFDDSMTSNTTLDGFTVQNVDPGEYVGDNYPVIGITGGSSYVYVKNCIVRDNQGSGTNGGIGLRGRWGTCPGVDCEEYNTAPVIENNAIHDVNGPGVGNGPNSHATVKDNTIWDCNSGYGVGIGIQGDTYPTIEGNTVFENDQAGIGSYKFGLEADPTPTNTLTIPPMTGNTIHDNGTAGISLVRAAGDTGTINATIGGTPSDTYDNEIYNNGSGLEAGILLDGLTNATVQYNEIYSNINAGIQVQGSFGQVNIQNANYIHDNTFAAGINKNGTGTLIVAENKINSNGAAGIRIEVGAGGSNTIIGNEIQLNLAAGIRVEDGSGTITQNDVHHNMAGIVFGEEASPNYDIIKNNVHENDTAGGIAIDPLFDPEATLIIRQNRVYGQTDTSAGGGIQVVATSGNITIDNNLVYDNGRGGVRFGPSTGSVKNTTAVGNGSDEEVEPGVWEGRGSGIIFSSNKPPDQPEGTASTDLVLENNISTHNLVAGTRVGTGPVTDPCPANADNRHHNLLYYNYEWGTGVVDPENTPPKNAADCGWVEGTQYAGNFRCVQQQYGGCGCDLLEWPPDVKLASANDVMADPLYVNKAGDDYHLQSVARGYGKDSPAITYPGSDTTQRGCYGGTYPMHNLIDVDTSTGNTLPAGGTYILFYLGASYDIEDVRLYGSALTTQDWTVYVGTSDANCDEPTWGSNEGTWSVGGASDWYPHTLTNEPVTGSYIKLASAAAVVVDQVFEFQFKEDGVSYWRTPSIVVDDGTCSDING